MPGNPRSPGLPTGPRSPSERTEVSFGVGFRLFNLSCPLLSTSRAAKERQRAEAGATPQVRGSPSCCLEGPTDLAQPMWPWYLWTAPWPRGARCLLALVLGRKVPGVASTCVGTEGSPGPQGCCRSTVAPLRCSSFARPPSCSRVLRRPIRALAGFTGDARSARASLPDEQKRRRPLSSFQLRASTGIPPVTAERRGSYVSVLVIGDFAVKLSPVPPRSCGSAVWHSLAQEGTGVLTGDTCVTGTSFRQETEPMARGPHQCTNNTRQIRGLSMETSGEPGYAQVGPHV